MSETIAPIFAKSLPIFEPNQVLTDEHLSALSGYLENEILLTRKKLIGKGIYDGLTFQTSPSAISIRSGAGVTSTGALIFTEFGPEQCYEHANLYSTKYAIDNNKRMPNVAAANVQFYELIPAPEPGEDPIKADKSVQELLQSEGDKGVLIFLEEIEEDVDTCFTSNCDDRGKIRYYHVIPMLVIAPSGTQASLGAPIMPDLSLQRIQLPISNAPGINQKYLSICNDKFLGELERAIAQQLYYYAPRLASILDRQFSYVKPELIKIRNETIDQGIYFAQYFYDFIADLTQALQEFAESTPNIAEILQQLEVRDFPMHLMLGNVLGSDNEHFERHHFSPARKERSAIEKAETSFFLLKRIIRMVHSFKVSSSAKLNITPSGHPGASIAEKCIPYYYEELVTTRLYRSWHQGLTQRSKEYQVLSFYNDRYNMKEAFRKPLKYLHSDKTQLQIEGLVGREKSDVMDELIALRKTHRLPFDIVALRVTRNVPLTELKPDPSKKEEYKEYNFKDFHEKHLGMQHEAGVRKGGTFIVVYETDGSLLDGTVVADFSLPYLCCCSKAPDKPFLLAAKDDTIKQVINEEKDIQVLKNDVFDTTSPIELDFLIEPEVEDTTVVVEANSTVDINISDEGIDPSAVEIDFHTT